MEIRFSLPDNPPRIGGRPADRDIERLAAKLDGQLAVLLQEAGRFAWARLDHGAAFSPGFARKTSEGVSEYIGAHAARRFNLEFCGESEVVGTLIETSISEYFGRAIAAQPGGSAEQPAISVGVIYVALALKLAGIDFDLDALATDYASATP